LFCDESGDNRNKDDSGCLEFLDALKKGSAKWKSVKELLVEIDVLGRSVGFE
jgi:hypothetical protein